MARPVSVFVNGTLVTVKTDSFSAEGRLEERGTASFVIVDTAGTGSYSQNMTVAVYSGVIAAPAGTPIYAGFIDSVEASPIGVSDGLFHNVSCKDNHYLADKRLVVKTYTSKTLAYIVNDLLTDYLAAEGITAGTIQTGPTIAAAIFNYVSVTQCFDALKDLSGYTWRVNVDKSLDFLDRTTNVAPWAVTGANIIAGTARRLGGNPSYRNKQYIRGGTGVTAEQTESRTSDGNTLAFTMGYPLALEPTVTLNGNPKTVGIKGVDTGKDCYWSKGDATITFDSVAGTSGQVIVVVYYGQYPLIAVSEDSGAILSQQALEGGTGIIESMITEAQHESSASISESAKGKLLQYCKSAEKFRFVTRSSGLLAGQLVTVTYSPFGYSAMDMLIESVNVSESANQLSYTVTAVTGPVLGSWTKLFSRILERQDKTIKVGDSRLLILLQQSETLELTEATSIDEDEFGVSGNVNRWLNSPPIDSGSLQNIQHERLELAETGELVDHPTEDYYWGEHAIGSPAINRASQYIYGKTVINLDNPATRNGVLQEVHIYAQSDMAGVKIGIFYATGGGKYKCRSAESVPNVIAGAEVIHKVGMAFQTGDYIGAYWASGWLERATSGYVGIVSVAGDKVVVGDESVYTTDTLDTLSLQGVSKAEWDFATWA